MSHLKRWRAKSLFCAVVLVSLRCVPADSLIPINTETVKKAVIFLFAADASGQPDTNKQATGFLVEIPMRTKPTRSYFVLVTARHVVDPVWSCSSTENPVTIYARVNRQHYDASRDTSGVEFIKVPLVVDNQPVWKEHTDDSVDAAVIPIDPAKFLANDIATVRISDFPNAHEIWAVGIGDDIISAGLVPGLSGKKRNYPFFNFGRVSNIPDERDDLPCGDHTRPITHWYIAATLVAGNSGSPIFRLPPGNAAMRFSKERPFLLGLQSTSVIAGEIAGLTPAQFIFEIIQSLNLVDANLDRGPVETTEPELSPKKPDAHGDEQRPL